MNISFAHNGRTYTNWDADAALAAGLPGDVVAAAVASIRKAEVSEECRRRIYAVASAEAQMNLTASIGVISAKTASARSADETATLSAASEVITWISDMRATVETLAADATADFTQDDAWPDVPEAVTDIIAKF